MHIYKGYSRPSVCDYLDIDSCLAFDLLTVIHHLLMHSCQIANDNGFQFYGYPLGRLHTNGNVRVVMSVLYPPTRSLVETHLDITPTTIQLVSCLMSLMTDSCPERLFRHLCCDIPDDLFL